jgi:hypothetical protein
MVYNTIQHPPPHPPQSHTVCVYCTFSLGRGRGGEVREKVEGATVHKLGRKYHERMFLQSIKSVKHKAAKSVNRPILKESQHIGFVVFIIHSSMLALLLNCTSLSHKLCAQYCRSGIVMPFISVAGTLVGESVSNPEMEFLDFNLTKDSSLLLLAIHSISTGGEPRHIWF